MNDIDLIIPVYNESENILKLIPKLKEEIKYKYRILFCYDSKEDDIFDIINKLDDLKINYELIKNTASGPCNAIKTGIRNVYANCCIVYPADDLHNYKIINRMYELFKGGNDIVVPSRFIKGGEMRDCPILKSILVRVGNYTLFKLSQIGVRDSSNGFRLFSNKIIKKYQITSNVGFTYSIELLIKAKLDGHKIIETPSKWIERKKGESNFKVFRWINSYFYWYLYAIKNNFLNK